MKDRAKHVQKTELRQFRPSNTDPKQLTLWTILTQILKSQPGQCLSTKEKKGLTRHEFLYHRATAWAHVHTGAA